MIPANGIHQESNVFVRQSNENKHSVQRDVEIIQA